MRTAKHTLSAEVIHSRAAAPFAPLWRLLCLCDEGESNQCERKTHKGTRRAAARGEGGRRQAGWLEGREEEREAEREAEGGEDPRVFLFPLIHTALPQTAAGGRLCLFVSEKQRRKQVAERGLCLFSSERKTSDPPQF